MVTQLSWLDRQWEFTLPLGYFPVILERFRGTPARIEDIVKSLPLEILTVRVNNSWSIQEHIGHLLDLSELDERRLSDYLSGAEVLSASTIRSSTTAWI